MTGNEQAVDGLAIVGMAGRFPKAGNIDELWRNLCGGVEGISFFGDEELAAAGLDAPVGRSNYVKARGVLEGAELFDAEFFGVNPKEAEVMDPQHRVFLECAWEALEIGRLHKYEGSIGVFAGMSMNTYLAANLASRPDVLGLLGEYQVMLGNDKDFLPTRVSYKLNLKGPSLNIQTACSTSLVAVCVACQHLLNHQCDMALAGAVSISFPQKKGYLYQEGGIASPDGHCRAFDAKAAGTVAGEGVGIVVLKRLADALRAGDPILAIIKGFALNNDGSNKIGYTAPSVEGQAEVIATAQAMAGVEPESISYIEAHGTGTPLGDPIEIEGLTKAFRAGTEKKNFCAVGSVKSSVGHLDTAAGVTGIIKTVLALQHKVLPPTQHFEWPNPKIDFANSPFFVNAKLAEWRNGDSPRRAGVSSFGIGGTNAHVVLEEAPVFEPSPKSRPAQLLVLSARTRSALENTAANLAEHLIQQRDLNLADVAHTLQIGRHDFAHRLMLVSRDPNDAASALAALDGQRVLTRIQEHDEPPVVFMFPGQGAQQVNMGRELYETELAFRETVDLCAAILEADLGCDLREVLYPTAEKLEAARAQLTQTALTQPAMFVLEYALAKLWMSWGVRPEAMIGHSVGEYVAACLSGVFSLEDALTLIAARGRLMQELPAGTMLAVRLSEREVRPLLSKQLSLAAVNGAALCVVSGASDAIEMLRQQLEARQVAGTPLQTSHAFHSEMMEPILKPFAELVRSVKRSAPRIPFISNVTGAWIGAEQATDPAYWARHLRQTVRFADGVAELLKVPERIFLEVGPGHTLSGLAKQHPARTPKTLVLSSLARNKDESSDLETLLRALGQLWLSGFSPDWRGFHRHEQRRRVVLPTYPFERKRYWVEPAHSRLQHSTGSLPGVFDNEPTTVEAMKFAEPPRAAESAGSIAGKADGASATGKAKIVSALRKILSDLSGSDLAGTDDTTTFTEMGFESLFLTQASLAIERTFGVRVAFRQLLEELSTLDALAAHLACAMPAAEPSASPDETADRPAGSASDGKSGETEPVEVPLTEGQTELWFAAQKSDANSCVYNECRLLHLRGALKTDELGAALQQLVNRHEALRSTFAPAGDSQRILPTLKLEVPFIDCSEMTAAEQLARLDDLQLKQARQHFDLNHGPLARAQLLRLSEGHHVLTLTVHHIVCDGHSLGILLHELGQIYSAMVSGGSSSLASPLQFSDYAREQLQLRLGPVSASDEAYWLEQFSEGAPVLDLPADYPRPAEWAFEGARVRHSISRSLGNQLERLGAQQGCTLFATLLAAYVLLLRRLANQEDIVVGIPAADRTMAGADTLVGHCINFLPVRLRVSDEQTFGAHLARVQRTFLDAHEHQRCAFGSLLQKLKLRRDASRMPLVSVTFNVERLSKALEFGGLEAELAANAHSFTHFDLSFNVTEVGGELQLDCRFNTSLFAAPTIRRWLGHFQALLEGIVAHPEQTISRQSLLSADEQSEILVQWNGTTSDYSREKCLHQLFEEQAARTPSTVAVVCRDERLTYHELNERADRLAGHLQHLGVGPDIPAGLCLKRSLELVVGLLAILKAGGAYVPLDPAYPKDRLKFMLENARAPVLLTDSATRDALHLGETGTKVVCLDDAFPGTTPRKTSAPPQAENLAYVIYTSGSTGVPKGVAIEHRCSVNFVRWAQSVFTPDELAGVLFSTSICFDLSVFELFVTLSSGGSVFIVENALQLAESAEIRGVTLINTVPSAAAELLRLNAIPASVRVINLAGEPLKPSLADRIYALGTVRKVYDLYGPSETTTYSTCALRQAGGPATIGRPIANTQLFILDANGQPVPVGVSGEIYIGGNGVARGYLHRPDLTTERFVPNPFDAEPGARLYKTGDLARWLPDGNIEFLGRADHQVKIRGYRVEPGEIDIALGQHDAVRECVTVAHEGSPGERQLAAYVVAESDQAGVTASELRAFLKTKLPDYMVPAQFVMLPAMPRTQNGKLDRKALPVPGADDGACTRSTVAPRTPTEELVAGVFRAVLNRADIGVFDSFFDLGGNSLMAARLMLQLRTASGADLPLRVLFERQTVAAVSEAIDGLAWLADSTRPPAAAEDRVEVQL